MDPTQISASMLYREQSELLHLRNLLDMEANILKVRQTYIRGQTTSRHLTYKSEMDNNMDLRLTQLKTEQDRIETAIKNVENEIRLTDTDIDRVTRQQTYIEIFNKTYSLPCASVRPTDINGRDLTDREQQGQVANQHIEQHGQVAHQNREQHRQLAHQNEEQMDDNDGEIQPDDHESDSILLDLNDDEVEDEDNIG